MIYRNAQQWLDAPQKKVLLFGMSGLGKTHVSNMLRASGEWFHYSIDYRIGTRYMGEAIVDNFKREAMKNRFLRGLLKTDSIHIGSNISFENLSPLSTYLGKPGNPDQGGLEFSEYQRRQAEHHKAEVSALLDTVHFANRANGLYGYDSFVADSGGSICEVVDPFDANDPVLTALSETLLLVGIESSAEHNIKLAERFAADPKPMCYQAGFLNKSWAKYLNENNVTSDEVNPDDFVRWTFSRALDRRDPIYRAMAERWGVSVTADAIAGATTPAKFHEMITRALDAKAA